MKESIYSINKSIKDLEVKRAEIAKLFEAEEKLKREEKLKFINKIKSTKDVDFMREILIDSTVLGTRRYYWQDFYYLCENPNLTDEIIDLLLKKEVHSQIVSNLLWNDHLTFLQKKRVLKNKYFRDLKKYVSVV